MKSIKMLLAVLPFLTLALFSCHKSDDNSNGGTNFTPASGTWKVSYFFDKQEETSNYSSFTFEFGSNGSMTATNGSQIWTGTWLTGFDDNANKFLMDFSGSVPSALSELEEDWRIIEVSENLMHFEHTSGGNGDTDVLKFKKG